MGSLNEQMFCTYAWKVEEVSHEPRLTGDLDMMAIEILVFLSKSSRNQNNSGLTIMIPSLKKQLLYEV